jgi:hypothetical protein
MNHKFRKVRIAFSAMCGIVCLFLIVMWVRSYGSVDALTIPCGNSRSIFIWSHPGIITIKSHPFHATWDARVMPRTAWPISGEWSWYWYEGTALVRFPYWLPVLLSVTAAPIAWLGCRFSLRTLLIATTLVAALLGAIVFAVK